MNNNLTKTEKLRKYDPRIKMDFYIATTCLQSI